MNYHERAQSDRFRSGERITDQHGGKPDTYVGQIAQNSSGSRRSLVINGDILSGASDGFSMTPFLPGMNAYTLVTEINSELINMSPIENTLFSLRTDITSDNLFSFDGTNPVLLKPYYSSDSYQLQTRVIAYHPILRFYLQCANDALSGTPIVYKWNEDGIEDVSSGIPNGEFRAGAYCRANGNLFFALVSGGNTNIAAYDGTNWTLAGTISGHIIQMVPFFDDDENMIFAATTSSVYKINFTTGDITADYSAGGTIQDIASTAWKLWVADLSGTTLTIKRRGSDASLIHNGQYSTDFTISNCTQAVFGMQYRTLVNSVGLQNQLIPGGRRPNGLFLAVADTDTNIWARMYRRMWSNGKDWIGSDIDNLWMLEDSIYTGGDTTGEHIGYSPVYYTSSTRIPRNSFVSLRKRMMITAPFEGGVDIWGRAYRRNVQLPQWKHIFRFNGYTIEDIPNMINPAVTARLYW